MTYICYSSLRLDLKQLEAGVFVLLTLILSIKYEYLVSWKTKTLLFGRLKDQVHQFICSVFQMPWDLKTINSTGHVDLTDNITVC